MVTGTQIVVFLVCLLAGSLACKSQNYEAYCYGSGGAADGNRSASNVYLCYQTQATCEKLQSKKARIAEGHEELGLQVGLCERTTTMYCATPTTSGEHLVCGPSQTTCNEVVLAAKSAGRMASECKKMSRADLDGLRKAKDNRRKGKQ